MDEDVSVIIPAYNEASFILQTLDSIRGIKGIREIFVVDDGSTDSTYQILKPLKYIVLLHIEHNKGKGYAVKHALKHVNGRFVALLDADLSESASEITKMLEHVKNDKKNIIIGKLSSPSKRGGFGIVKYLSHCSFQVLTSKRVDSLLSGQRIVPVDFLKSVELPDDFGLEFKITLEGVRRGIEIIEVPVNMRHRETGRNIKGFLHRGKQCIDILSIIKNEIKL